MKTFSLILVFLSLFFVGKLHAQQTYTVIDADSREPVSFVKVYPEPGIPFLADIDGKFSLQEQVVRVRLYSYGYKDTTFVVADLNSKTIELASTVTQMDEITVNVGENPALRIINQAIANRKKNNPMGEDAFRYESYSKFLVDIDRTALGQIPDSTTDSTLIEIRKFFNEQYIFLLESASERAYMPPARDQERITAYKVSGFTDPMFSTFASEMQSFSFYENQFNLLGKTYLNPIALGGTKRYFFSLKDTTVSGQDTTFTIFYKPRYGKNFDGLTGYLYINTNGFAVEKVTAEPFSTDSTQARVQIVQEYTLIDGKKWFPVKLSSQLVFSRLMTIAGMKGADVIGKGNTYIRNVQLNPPDLRKKDFSNVSVITDSEAGEVSDDHWDTLRVDAITQMERTTYHVIDSLSKAEKLEQKMMLLPTLLEGKIPLGKFNFDLMRLLDYDLYEKYRIGGGLETSKKLMKHAVIGGYYGWSTGDKTSKYGGYASVYFNKQHSLGMQMRYQQDLLERGGTVFRKDQFSLLSNSYFQHFYIRNMDRQRLADVAFTGIIRSNMKVTVCVAYQRIQLTENYVYYPNPVSQFDLAEASVEWAWNIREKVMMVGDTRVSKGTKWPKLKVKMAKGWKDIGLAAYDYVRLNTEIQQTIPLKSAGTLIWTLKAGQTWGDVPLTLLQVASGTGKDWYLSVANTFETMRPSEFYAQQQVGLFTRFNIRPFKTKAKWNEPQICIHHAIGYGEMNKKADHSVAFRSMDKGFFEGGLILNNLYVSSFYGLGVGVFYRYGTYADMNWKKNFLPKISLSFVF